MESRWRTVGLHGYKRTDPLVIQQRVEVREERVVPTEDHRARPLSAVADDIVRTRE